MTSTINTGKRGLREGRRATFVTRPALSSYVPWVLVAFCAFCLIAWAAASHWNIPYFGLGNYDAPLRAPSLGRVATVYPDSPSARAGFQAGDQVVSIVAPEGTSLWTVLYDTPNRAAPVRLLVTVRRGDTTRSLTLTPTETPPSVAFARFVSLGVALLFWAIGLVVWGLQPFHGVTRIFFLLCNLSAGMLSAGALSSMYYPNVDVSAYMFRVLLTALAPVAFHFYASFPNPLPPLRLRRLLRLVYGGAALVLLLTVVLPIATIKLLPEPSLQLIQRSYVGLVLIAALALLFRAQNRTGADVRYRRRLLIAGMVGSILPLMALSFIPELITRTPLLPYPYTFLALVLLPASVAVAVKQGELGQVDFWLNRSLVYVLLTTLLVGLYALVFWGLDRFISGTALWSRSLLAGGLAVVAIALYNPLRTYLQRLIDRLFYGGWYNYQKVVRASALELNRALDVAQLSDRLLDIARTMRFQAATLLWPQPGELAPRGSFGYEATRLQQWRVPTGGVLARYLTSHPAPHDLAQLRAVLQPSLDEATDEERALLEQPSVQLWLPLVSRGALRGVMLLGQRQGEMVLGEEDLNILGPLAGQAAVAAENVALLETLRARLAEMEQMRNELAEAHRRLVEDREASQLRLARDLHDGAVQQLLGISYQLVRKTWEPAGVLDLRGAAAPAQDLSPLARSAPALQSAVSLAEAPLTPDVIRQEMLSVVSQLRGLIAELRPAGLDEFGLSVALEGYVARLEREGGWAIPVIELDLPATELELPESVSLALFRTAQEALRNAIRHAEASHVTLRLRVSSLSPGPGREVTLTVLDDGKGFRVPGRIGELVRDDHFGLVGMSERVEWVGGKLAIESGPGLGVRVTACVPLDRSGVPGAGDVAWHVEHVEHVEGQRGGEGDADHTY